MAQTGFVQRAIVEFYGPSTFERILILVTKTSRGANLQKLLDEFHSIAVPASSVTVVEVSENLADEASQWQWFEQVLAFVDSGDLLHLDMTHGFRIVPIVLSSAIGYLQAVKSVELGAVLYGVEADGQIVDFKSFYRVNAWADAVSRLVEKADADKLADLAQGETNQHFESLRDPEVIAALRALTGLLANINVHAVASQAKKATELLQTKIAAATGAERQMLMMVADKFAVLVTTPPASGKYSKEYLQVQIQVARMLMEHGLLMQGFTVMRELVGSLGMLGLRNSKYDKPQANSDGRDLRRRFAEVFVNMVQYEESKWKFPNSLHAADKEQLLPWYRELEQNDLLTTLRDAYQKLSKIRNGFDHAWTGQAMPKAEEIKSIGFEALEGLDKVVESINIPQS